MLKQAGVIANEDFEANHPAVFIVSQRLVMSLGETKVLREPRGFLGKCKKQP